MRKAPQRSREENIVLVLSKAVLVLEPDWEARSVIINIHGLMFLLNAMVPVEYEYEYEHEYEHEQYHYGTIKFRQSPGKAGGFLGIITRNSLIRIDPRTLFLGDRLLDFVGGDLHSNALVAGL